jgi:galactose oxidase-like protein/Kelch motif protein
MTRFWELRSWAIAGLLALSVLRCGSNVEPTTATDIAKANGDNQIGTVNLDLASPLVVLVTDANNNGVPGVIVTWQAQGGGSVSSKTAKTRSDGQASVTRTLGPTPGVQTTTATVASLNGSPVTFEATAVEGSPTGGIVITTNPPVGALTREVFDPTVQPVVRVTLVGGNPAVGQEVTASIASGGGALEGKTTATADANGIARFTDLGINGTGDHTIKFSAGTATVTSSPVSLSVLSEEASKGKWDPVVPWDIVPLHMSLLPNGKIFAWGKRNGAGTPPIDSMGMPRIWDPASGLPSSAAEIHGVNDMLFCAGHTLLPDGRLMVNGGHHMDGAGIKVTYFFSQDGAATKGPDMMFGRWYPTLTVLPNGNVLTMAGRNEAGTVVTTPELWTGNSWTQLTGAGTLKLPYYPRNFVDPVRAGQVFYAGEQVMSRWFNYGGSGSWTTSGPRHIWNFNREYGTAVMYDTGKILYAGGGGDAGWNCECPAAERSSSPTATAEKIDLTQANPRWENAGSMSVPRRHLNSTILPDGQVLITGGTRGGGFVDFSEANAVHAAEVWDPRTGQWTKLAANHVVRVYHSVSLLLPDGTVLHGASGDAMTNAGPVPPERNHEIFEPPYLFKGARPTISSAPAVVGYASTFSLGTPNAAQITDVRWIRLGSVTHAFDMGQRANTLSFTPTATGVDVTAPARPELAPPGYYQIFILNRNGVPSKGKIVKVQ